MVKSFLGVPLATVTGELRRGRNAPRRLRGPAVRMTLADSQQPIGNVPSKRAGGWLLKMGGRDNDLPFRIELSGTGTSRK